MTAPGTRRHIYDTKLGTDKCDNSSMSLQMGYMQGAKQSSQVFGLGRQIYDPKYCPQGPAADGAPGAASDCPSPGAAKNNPLTTVRRLATEAPVLGISSHHHPIWVLWVSVFSSCFFYVSECFQLRVCREQVKARSRCVWGGEPWKG